MNEDIRDSRTLPSKPRSLYSIACSLEEICEKLSDEPELSNRE